MKKKVEKTIKTDNGTLLVYEDGSMEEIQDMDLSLNSEAKAKSDENLELMKKYKKMKKSEI